MAEPLIYASFPEPLQHAVRNWLKERQELLVLMCGIKSTSPLSNKTVPTGTRIQNFCQLLMDYVSAAHFEIFDGLTREIDQDVGSTWEKVQRLYSRLQPSTDSALRFNDLYDSDESCEDLEARLSSDLSDLGLALEERFRIEDEILALINTTLSQQSAVALV